MISERDYTNILNTYKAEGEARGRAEGLAEGEAKGRAEGLSEGKTEVARAMNATSLSMDEIDRL